MEKFVINIMYMYGEKRMVDVITREGYLAGYRRRKCDLDKNPIEDWSEWHFRSANGSGYFSYVYSGPGKAGFSKDKTERKAYNVIKDYEYAPRPEYPTGFRYGSPEYMQYELDVEKWRKGIPVIGYIEVHYKAVPARIVVDEEELQ